VLKARGLSLERVIGDLETGMRIVARQARKRLPRLRNDHSVTDLRKIRRSEHWQYGK